MKEILQILSDNSGEVIFNDPITVKDSPHSWPNKITRAFIQDGLIFYENKEGIIRECKEGTKDYYSIYQRLRLLKIVDKTIL